MDPMPPPREQPETGPRLRRVGGLGQRPPAAGDDGVGAENEGIGEAFRDGPRLGGGETAGQFARQFATQRPEHVKATK